MNGAKNNFGETTHDASSINADTSAESVSLSICIATFKRGDTIAQALECICAQLTPAVEIVVVDGNSPDDTEAVVRSFQKSHDNVRYFRESTNSGVDQDFDKAVGYARGDYCWLMTDDDLLTSNAIERVLSEISSDPELLILDAQVRSGDFTRILQPSRMFLEEDHIFDKADNSFLRLAGDQLSFIGSVVIRRTTWLARDRQSYYGSLFIHVGVILQSPSLGPVKVIAQPLIQIRYGNAMWSPRGFEIWMLMWPSLIWSFDQYESAARRAVCDPEPWKQSMALLKHRAKGSYSLTVYEQFIRQRCSGWDRIKAKLLARIPAKLANFMAVAYVVTIKRQARLGLSDLLESPYASRASMLLSRMLPLSEIHE